MGRPGAAADPPAGSALRGAPARRERPETAVSRATSRPPFRLGIVVATKDRPDDLRVMLASLAAQSVPPDQVVVVDASATPVESITRRFPTLDVLYLRHLPPSAAAQRNAGLAAVRPDIDLIGFMDDDAVLEPGAMEHMFAFWACSSSRVGGASFNLLNPPGRVLTGLKGTRLVSWLGIYDRQRGGVARSGWQSVVGTAARDVRVEWLPTTASVWRRGVFCGGGFDAHYDGYSYLEDLDFSYGVSREHELWVVAAAGFRHHPSSGGRIDRYQFGKIEVVNRLHVVRKHRLCVWRCYLGLLVRMGLTLASAVVSSSRAELDRLRGNLAGLGLRGASVGSRTARRAARAAMGSKGEPA